ncbi:ATP-binding protein [Sphingomonas sp. RB3P16]|uniref:PAS domain-containing sensor histidine kinase n=1 Tax=Parasphingomonas frigoris TaxID=3096163 RepID=UPI002FCA1135
MKSSVSRATAEGAVTDAQLLLDAITDYAIYQLDADGIVCSWNAPAQRFKGYSAKDIIGRHFSCFYTEEDIGAGVPARALATSLHEGRFEDEGWRVRADGRRLWASVVINPIFEADGSHKGFVKITRDISDKRAAADSLREANGQIAQVQKMESLGRVAGGVAHDFNNLLTAIMGSVDHLKSAYPDPAMTRHIDTIEFAAEQAAQLTSQLLAFARSQPLKPTRFSMRNCIKELLPLLQAVVGGKIVLSAHLATDDCTVDIDLTQFRAAILNLVTNSKHAIQSDGVIELRTQIFTAMPAVRKHHAIVGRFVGVSVIDTGSGIPVDIRDKVFEPFFTTKELLHGTGLGLSQVYGFTKQSGGNVAISPAPHHGTTITLYLPLSPVQVRPDAVAALQAKSDGPPNASILFVEDNKIVGASAVRGLVDLGYEVSWLEDGDAALAILSKQPGSFDIIITDIIMPGMSGFEFAKRARDMLPEIPVIVTSGYTNQLAQIETLDYGFVGKPYRLDDLSQCIRINLDKGPVEQLH